jgi:DNA-binding response OmpR family regulator
MERTILVVDDDPTLAATLVELFIDEGYLARCVHDGIAALREIERGPPDLVISDILLPGMSGLTLLQEVRLRGLTLPIVFMSSVVRRLSVPHVRFLAKPFDLDELLHTVHQVLDATG